MKHFIAIITVSSLLCLTVIAASKPPNSQTANAYHSEVLGLVATNISEIYLKTGSFPESILKLSADAVMKTGDDQHNFNVRDIIYMTPTATNDSSTNPTFLYVGSTDAWAGYADGHIEYAKRRYEFAKLSGFSDRNTFDRALKNIEMEIEREIELMEKHADRIFLERLRTPGDYPDLKDIDKVKKRWIIDAEQDTCSNAIS